MTGQAAARLKSTVVTVSTSLPAHRALVVGVVFVAVGVSVFSSIHYPRGILRRVSTGYVARIDAQQQSMYLPCTGATMGWIQLGIVVTALLLYGVIPTAPLLVVAALAAIVPPVHIKHRIIARRAKIDGQAHGFALALANSLKATASIGDALRGACDVTAKPLRDEVAMVLQQMRVGSTLEEALLALSARVQSMALDVVVSTLLIGRQTGGDLPRILEGTAGSLRELKRLEEMTDKVLRGAKRGLAGAAFITAGLPVLVNEIMPGFLDPLRDTIKGQIISAQLAFGFVLALYMGYRFTRKSV